MSNQYYRVNWSMKWSLKTVQTHLIIVRHRKKGLSKFYVSFAQLKIPHFQVYNLYLIFEIERRVYNIAKAPYKVLENNLEFGINFVTLEQLLAKRSTPNQLQSFWICCLIEQLPTFQRSLIFNGFDFSIGAFISNGHEIEFDPRVLDPS